MCSIAGGATRRLIGQAVDNTATLLSNCDLLYLTKEEYYGAIFIAELFWIYFIGGLLTAKCSKLRIHFCNI